MKSYLKLVFLKTRLSVKSRSIGSPLGARLDMVVRSSRSEVECQTRVTRSMNLENDTKSRRHFRCFEKDSSSEERKANQQS